METVYFLTHTFVINILLSVYIFKLIIIISTLMYFNKKLNKGVVVNYNPLQYYIL